MNKKIITSILCAALAALSVTSSSAAQPIEKNEAVASSSSSNYIILKSEALQNNYSYFFKSGANLPNDTVAEFRNVNTGETVLKQKFDFSGESTSCYLPDPNGYHYRVNGGGSLSRVINLTQAGGKYQKIRLKLSDFSDYFMSNGKREATILGNKHYFNFSDEGNGYSSSLVFISGGAMTSVAPDIAGMAEIYVSTKLGEKTTFITSFSYTSSTDMESRTGTAGTDFTGLTIGDVDKNGSVRLSDAILIQKYILDLSSFDSLSKRNADANQNGKVNLLDAIAVQKYAIK
ncbi:MULTISPECIES: dockerin type I repeat-containing protein [unclassified Ruminococcus]|uniref:dockerin type I repeat-containing protein n=1 Tax=unclassified Ruminococcus TaxID=2608920 RepID=UPI00210AC227|nr:MULTISPECIES: dockerin type I repeat-containing protein [unclassified Ruminococcus]MCQ4021469.1 hypothetical protein [Ruminococcus sp. zg-924]MCQ4113914.1 hypothetical protein [Ruminococcus sp. zg-921]